MFVNDYVNQLLKSKKRFEDDPDNFKVARWVTDGEGAILHMLGAAHTPQASVEVGTANGWSACWLASSEHSVYTFDTADRPKVYTDSGFENFQRLIRFQPRELLKEDLDKLKELDKKLYFIDGDHTSKGVKANWRLVQPYLKPKDIVVFHDATTEEGVVHFWLKLQETRASDFHFQTFKTERGIGVLRLK